MNNPGKPTATRPTLEPLVETLNAAKKKKCSGTWPLAEGVFRKAPLQTFS